MHTSEQTLRELILTGNQTNFELALQLAEGQNIRLDTFLADLQKLKIALEDISQENFENLPEFIHALRNGGLECWAQLTEPCEQLFSGWELVSNLVKKVQNTNFFTHTLPTHLSIFRNLEILRWEMCELPEIPAFVYEFEHLQELELKTKNLGFKSFSPKPEQLIYLKKLVLDASQRVEFLPTPTHKRNLNSLIYYVSKYSLSASLEFPSAIFELSQLQYLYLGGYIFKSIPPEIRQLQQLKRLEIGFMKFRRLPYELLDLENLESLTLTSLDKFKISEHWDFFAEFKQLRHLTLNDAEHLDWLSPELAHLDFLQTFRIQGAGIYAHAGNLNQSQASNALLADFQAYLPNTQVILG
jgi:Leucine-rich repeat (LRR) protein